MFQSNLEQLLPPLLSITKPIEFLPILAALISFIVLIFVFLKNFQLQKKIKDTQNRLDLSNEKVFKLKQKVAAAMEARRSFLANISHEIRTPLNGIFGLTSQLKKEHLNEKQKELLFDIELLTQNLSSLLSDILDYTKLETGQLVLDEINFHLINELSPELTYYRKKCAAKDLVFNTYFDQNLPLFIKGDPNRLKQIVNNLLSNSVKFTAQGNISFKCELEEEKEDEVAIKITIEDSGCGISAANKELVWQTFHQINESNIRDNGGTGIGLSISKKLVEIMQGSIDFESAEGQGTKFWFSVHLKKGITPNLLSQNSFNKILLVEDNLINQRVSLFSLRKLGFEVDLAENGQIAIDKFRQNEYDLILMDIQMPVMDGITSATKIRSIEQEEARAKKVHIIALTANSLNEDREKCMLAGINGYISKPFSLDKFPVVISQFNGTH